MLFFVLSYFLCVCVCVCVCVHARACVCVCVISNQSTSKKPHVSNLSKLDACQKSSGCGDLERVSKLGQNLRKEVGNIGRGSS